MLEVRNLTKTFGGLVAVNRADFTVSSGEILAVIGPNGAGKTTIFNLITGILAPDKGEIKFQNRLLNRMKPYQIARLGISRTFQNLELFRTMTVAENVMVGAYTRDTTGFIGAMLRRPGTSLQDQERYAEAVEILRGVGLADYADEQADSLPFGLQRLLEIARALASRPKLVLLDEPAAGLNASESQALVGVLRSLQEQGLTFVLVEHDMTTVMDVADRIVVLNFGSVIASGAPAEIRSNAEVIRAYLGEDEP
ncbi:MAG: ABC transporter ATP-binding protein [Candidatus Desulforudis sp.]|nr:ABC transporter ATP-binding protein [Desulforudis sp.]